MYKSWNIEDRYGSEYLGTKVNKGYHGKYKHGYIALNEILSTLYALVAIYWWQFVLVK